MEFKTMKFLVANPKQSEELQKVLFRLGYSWFGNDGLQIQFPEQDAIFTNGDGSLGYSDSGYFYEDTDSEWMDTAKFIDFHTREKCLENAYDIPDYLVLAPDAIEQGRTINMTEAIELAKNSGVVFIQPEVVKHNKYMREIKPGVWVDVYDVIRAFAVTDGALQHLMKKALAVGQRGHKDTTEDYKDIVASSKRALEIHEEWNP